ncbi:MAG TPA: DUF881 domain-containing protein [Actinomycetales bacterium]|nr:DUF881 domain-containing protein [Actinomycetales bacterium]
MAPGQHTAAKGDKTSKARKEADLPTARVDAKAARGRLFYALRPRLNRSQLIVALLCCGLGFALVVQVQQNQQDSLGSLRQSELVRLLDEVTSQSSELARTERELRATRDELLTGTDSARTAYEALEDQVTRQAILAGTVPVEGPGVSVRIIDNGSVLDSYVLLEVMQELRNAGAEAIEVNGERIVASSWFVDSSGAIVLDGTTLSSPYRVQAIGDAATISAALEMPGGVLTGIRSRGASAVLESQDEISITSYKRPSKSKFATPDPAS